MLEGGWLMLIRDLFGADKQRIVPRRGLQLTSLLLSPGFDKREKQVRFTGFPLSQWLPVEFVCVCVLRVCLCSSHVINEFPRESGDRG